MMNPIQQALSLKFELDTLRPIAPELEARVMQKLRLDWNYHSNHLEGNSLNYGETKALLLFGITAQGKPLKDHFEITGHNEAIDWVLDVVKGDMPLSESFIRQLHVLLLKEPYTKKAKTAQGLPTSKTIQVGQYKTTDNHVETVTGEMFYFASALETPAKMEELIAWYAAQQVRTEVNPILLAAEFHYRFIRIHPFDDGNGRTARILMNFILMRFDYPPAVIKTEDKTNYFAVLQQADAGLLDPFVDYIAENVIRSLSLMIAGVKGENFDEDDASAAFEAMRQRLNSGRS
jgi:Fic family protein